MTVIRREKKKLSVDDIKKVENFIGGSESKFEAAEPSFTEKVAPEPTGPAEETKELKADKAESKDMRMYSLRIPADIYEKIELYVFKNRRNGANIRKFIIEAVMEKIEKEEI